MLPRSLLCLALILLACGPADPGEPTPTPDQTPTATPTEPPSPTATPGTVTETFHYATPQVDLLLVLANSSHPPYYFPTLSTQLERLAGLLDQRELDWRVGVTGMDVDSPDQPGTQGQLTSSGGARWVDLSTAPPRGEALAALCSCDGTDMSWERSFDAIRAMPDRAENAGFLRPGAHWAVLVASKDDDISLGMTPTTFSTWFSAYKGDDLGTSFHTLVGPPGGSVDGLNVDPGYRFHDARGQIGGLDLGDVGDSAAYGAAFDALAAGLPVPAQRFDLGGTPDPTSLAVAGPLGPLQQGSEWRYDATTDQIVITTTSLMPGAELTVTYRVL